MTSLKPHQTSQPKNATKGLPDEPALPGWNTKKLDLSDQDQALMSGSIRPTGTHTLQPVTSLKLRRKLSDLESANHHDQVATHWGEQQVYANHANHAFVVALLV